MAGMTNEEIARDIVVAALAEGSTVFGGRPDERAAEIGKAYRTILLAVEEARDAAKKQGDQR